MMIYLGGNFLFVWCLYIYIYIYVCVCVCICMYMCVCVCNYRRLSWDIKKGLLSHLFTFVTEEDDSETKGFLMSKFFVKFLYQSIFKILGSYI